VSTGGRRAAGTASGKQADGVGRRRTRVPRARPGEVLLRRLPGDSPVHRLWAGTKLLALTILTVTVAVVPSWPVIAATAALTLVGVRLARVPVGAVPRLPAWLLIGLAAGLALALVGGGLSAYLRVLSLSVVFTVASAVVAWTTAPAELAPALARLGAPLRRLGLPVDQWAAVIGLCVRSLPLLLAEVGVLLAARRLRRRGRPGPRRVLTEVTDLLTAAAATAVRRADELGDAITARGGLVAVGRGRAPGRSDAVALLVVLAGSVLPVVLGR
jgi:energy-coupling factor transport system permease protein